MQIEVNRISTYMPHRLTDKELENGFIARHDLFNLILEKLKGETQNSIPQHFLVIGQRGMGKTTLLLRLDLELRKNTLYNHLIPLSFPEEQYNVDRLSKFWLNCLDALADTLEVIHEEIYVKEIDDFIGRVNNSDSEKLIEEKTYSFLNKLLLELNKRAVLLIDNLNQIFESLSENEQWELRNRITKEGSPILIGASSEPLKEEYDYKAPFFDSFEVFMLEKLSFDEMLTLLETLAKRTGETEILKRTSSKKPQLKTLYTLTGGNPRTIVILFKVFAKGFSSSVYQDLDALLEAVTPIYKAKFEELSLQSQVIVDSIALNWDPCRLEELRQSTRLENSKLSPQIKRLKEIGWITQIESFSGRGTSYEISERFFNVWYLMRRSSRRQRRDLVCLTRFLESLYGEEVRKIAEEYLKDPVGDVNHVTYGLALANAMKDDQLQKQIRNKALDNLIEQDIDEKELKMFEISDEYKTEKNQTLNKELFDAIKKNDNELTSSVLKKKKRIGSEKSEILYAEGCIEMMKSNYIESEKFFRESLKIDKNFIDSWNSLGNLLQLHLRRPEEAEDCYRRAIEVEHTFISPWYGLGYLLHYTLSRYNEAEDCYRQVLKIDNTHINAWYGLGNLFQYNFKKYEEAEQYYFRAIELDNSAVYALCELANLLQYNLKKFKEAELYYKKTIELDSTYPRAWFELARLYLFHLEQPNEAERCYKKAIELDNTDTNSLYFLGGLYQYYLNQPKEAKKCYNNVIKLDNNYLRAWYELGNLFYYFLRQPIRAENCYQNTIRIDNHFERAWYELGNLSYLDFKKFAEAEEYYRNAIELENDNLDVWYELANLLQKLNRFEEAEKSYKKAIELDNSHASSWIKLGNLYQFNLIKYEEAEKCYRKAIELDKSRARAWFGLANLYQVYSKNYIKAEEYYKEGIKTENDNPYAWFGLGSLYQYHLNQSKEAEDCYKKAIELDSLHLHSWYELGNLYKYDLNEVKEAEDCYKKVIELDPKFIAAFYELSNLIHYYLKQPKEAEIYYRKTLELDNHHARAWYGLGNLYQHHLNQPNEAEIYYRKAIEFDDTYASFHLRLGYLLHHHLNRLTEAEEYYRNAIELENDNLDVWYELANLLQKLNRFEEAEKSYKKAIELDNSRISSYFELGNLYQFDLQKYEEAEQCYRKAIELNDSYALAWFGLANLYQIYLRKYEESEQCYIKTTELDSKNPYAWFGFATLLQRSMNRYKESEECYRQALKIKDDVSYWWDVFGDLLLNHTSKYSDAVMCFENAIKLDPNSNTAKYNLIFLLRDKLNHVNQAYNLLQEMDVLEDKQPNDTYYLNKALFGYYEKNLGVAEKYLKEALGIIGESFRTHTIEDWQRVAAIIIKLGYGNELSSLLKETGHYKILRPYYEAIQALNTGTDDFLISIAAEIREPAREIYDYMKRYANS